MIFTEKVTKILFYNIKNMNEAGKKFVIIIFIVWMWFNIWLLSYIYKHHPNKNTNTPIMENIEVWISK